MAWFVIRLPIGLRKAEARKLQAGRCLLAERQLVVIQGKGGKDRVVPLTGRLTAVLADLFLLDGLEPEDVVWYAKQAGGIIIRSRPVGEGTFHRW